MEFEDFIFTVSVEFATAFEGSMRVNLTVIVIVNLELIPFVSNNVMLILIEAESLEVNARVVKS